MPTKMFVLLAAAVAAGLAGSGAVAQQITPVWVEHINGVVAVTPTNKLPILQKAGGSYQDTHHFDGSDVIDSYAGFLRYDDNHYLLGIRENGINETDPALSAELRTRAAAYPDRSIIWIDAKTGKPLGIALKTEVHPVPLAAGQSINDPWWKWGVADGTNGTRAIYTGYKYKILRYAPTGVAQDPAFPGGRPTWSATPTEAWVEPVPDEPNPSLPPYVDRTDPDQVTAWVGSSAGEGSEEWRFKAFRVWGSGNDTKIFAGGANGLASMAEQEFVTDDGGLTFYPIARLNDRGDGCGAKGALTLGGEPSTIRTTTNRLEWCIQAHYPAAGWEVRPGRYVKDPSATNACPDTPWWLCDTCVLSDSKTNQPTRPNYFDPVEGAVDGLPAFDWEAAGKDGRPIDHSVDGVLHYDGNWVMTTDTKEGVDYIVSYAIPSWGQVFGEVGATNAIFKPGWIGLHTMDGRISTGAGQGQTNAYKLPVYETDEPITEFGVNGSTSHEYGYDGDIQVYPDADGKGGALVLWSGGTYGFGVFRVQNVPASITEQPQGGTKSEGEPFTLTAGVEGGANLYQWLKDNEPIPLATSPSLIFDHLQLTDAGKYKLRVLNRLGDVESAEVSLSVVPDNAGPTIVSAVAANSPNAADGWIEVVFSERVTPQTAGNAANYTLNGGATISEAVVVSDNTVTLKTSAFTPATQYTLSVRNIRDQSPAGNLMLPNTRQTFTVALKVGALLWEFYPAVPGSSVDALVADAAFPENPARREFVSSFTTEPNLSDIADGFGARLSGWITPAESGSYEFFLRSDGASRLDLSPDEDPDGAVPIAVELSCCNPFLEPGDGVTQTSSPVVLLAGNHYFIQALYKGSTNSSDTVEVAWREEGDLTPAGQLQPIKGQSLGFYRSGGSEPTEPPSLNVQVLSNNEITLTWTGTATLEESTDLKTWTAVAGNPASGFKVLLTGPQKFYRLSL